MTERPTPVAAATDVQRRASDPAVSAWVSANAGSGKTYVLVNRVIRLLRSGCRPDQILCLTFTKAAAAEMSNRLFRVLGEWTTLDSDELARRLESVEGRRPADEDDLKEARKLFASAVETPGGLKIQTIHAFCESVLQRFPLEAGVPPGFTILDERAARERLADIRDRMLVAARSGGALGEAFARLEDNIAESGLDSLLKEALLNRTDLVRALDGENALAFIDAWLRARFELAPDATPESLLTEAASLDDEGRQVLERVAHRAAQGGKKDGELAERIVSVLDAVDDGTRFEALEDLYLTTQGKPRKSLMTKSLAADLAPEAEWLEAAFARFLDLREARWSATLVVTTLALMEIVRFMLEGYGRLKAARGELDYEDLITGTVRLFSRSSAAWVLYKLDNGIDHVLVDEAQDTSPEQWAVIQALTSEFFAGEGARSGPRTVFAVGDEKQSIYSFQGARPEEFEAMRSFFGRRAERARMDFTNVPLTVSFRSVARVLEAVDLVFADPDAARGLGADADRIVHQAVRGSGAGRVELWPPVVPEDDDDEGRAWDEPLDRPGPLSPRVRLAETIARRIRGWIGTEELASRGRPVAAGDILILVRRRDAFADAMVRALKRHGVAVAGADRLVLTDHIAVLDLIALARFVLLPDDDLSLATVLKSPLVCAPDGGWLDDNDLFALAYGRQGSLWAALAARADGPGSRFADAYRRLSSWLNRADRVPPYEFFAAVLGADGGRERFKARLGEEADDPLDAFLDLALDYERNRVPSLEDFVHWIGAAQTEIKRDMEHGRDEVRIMTVHGAKGLEANIVILPDTCSVPGHHHDPGFLFLEREGGGARVPVWSGRAPEDNEALAEARLRSRNVREAEYNRLLYVALTRASDRLYVCGYEGKRGRPENCWYDLVSRALRDHCRPVVLDDGEEVLRMDAPGDGDADPDGGAASAVEACRPPPAWALRDAPPEPPLLRPLSPSRLEAYEAGDAAGGGQAVLSPLEDLDGRRFLRGRLIHRLLQYLPDWPPGSRFERAREFASRFAPDLEAGVREQAVDEVLAIVGNEAFAPLFSPLSRAEVPLTARLPVRGPDGRPLVISGQVDRIAAAGDSVLVVDYKTNRPPPLDVEDVAPLYLRQMAAYRLAISEVFPGKTVTCFLLWTDGPRLMELPSPLLEDVFARLGAG